MSSNNFSEVFNYLFEIKKINAINQEDELKLEFWKILPKLPKYLFKN